MVVQARGWPATPALGRIGWNPGSLVVEGLAPGFGALAGVAVAAEADAVEDSVVSASDSCDSVVELQVNLAGTLRVAVGVGAAAALPAPQGVSQLFAGDALHVLSSGRLAGVCRDEIKQGQACG